MLVYFYFHHFVLVGSCVFVVLRFVFGLGLVGLLLLALKKEKKNLSGKEVEMIWGELGEGKT